MKVSNMYIVLVSIIPTCSSMSLIVSSYNFIQISLIDLQTYFYIQIALKKLRRHGQLHKTLFNIKHGELKDR